MEANERIGTFLDDVTAGLRDDPELRLDVRAELLSHLEERMAALRAKGKSEQESLELALRSFGSATDVAGGLVAANRRRMKVRALARLAARAILVPAAVVVATVVCDRVLSLCSSVGATRMLLGVLLGKGDDGRGWAPQRAVDAMVQALPDQKAFLFRGDPARPTRAAQQRAIWEAHPENKAYYGNYITHLVDDYFAGQEQIPLDLVTEELRRGETLEPDNARYNVLLAGVWLKNACDLKEHSTSGPNGTKGTRWELVVKDRALLDRAMAELLKAARKPYSKTYGREMLEEQLALLGPARRFEDNMARLVWMAEVLLPDLQYGTQLVRAAPRYAELLIGEGRAAEAEPCLEAWRPLALKWNDDGFTPLEQLVFFRVVKIGGREATVLYEKLGKPGEAEKARRWSQRLCKPLEDSNEQRRSPRGQLEDSRLYGELQASGSLLDGLLLPALDHDILRQVDLSTGRRLEHVLIEEAGVSLCLLMLLGLMAGALIAALRWRWTPGTSSAPLLLLPGWRTGLRILGLAVLLPLAAFYVYTRWSGLAGREYSIRYLGFRFVLELLLLAITILLLSLSMATGAIRRRCETLGIRVPKRVGRLPRVLLWAALGLAWALCWTMRGNPHWLRWETAPCLGLAAIGLLLAFAILLGAHWLFGSRAHGLYRGTMARSLIPVFAAGAILTGALAQCYLRAREVSLVHGGTVARGDAGLLGLTRAEALMVERLKEQVRQAAAELEAGSPRGARASGPAKE